MAMLSRLRGRVILGGVRGQPPIDTKALAGAISALSRLAVAHPEIVELDVNPVIARPDGVTAVDWLIVAEGAS